MDYFFYVFKWDIWEREYQCPVLWVNVHIKDMLCLYMCTCQSSQLLISRNQCEYYRAYRRPSSNESCCGRLRTIRAADVRCYSPTWCGEFLPWALGDSCTCVCCLRMREAPRFSRWSPSSGRSDLGAKRGDVGERGCVGEGENDTKIRINDEV